MTSLSELNCKLKSALENVRRRFAVFPLFGIRDGGCMCSGGSHCANPGKHPIYPGGYKSATLDHELIHKFWGEHPSANIAIATGEISKIFVLDFDERHNGLITLDKLQKVHGQLPPTFTVRTGNGVHFYFAHPGFPVKSGHNRVGEGADVKGDGGYVVGAGSDHWTGACYEVKEDAEIAEAPVWLLALISPKRTSITDQQDDTIPKGRRNETLARFAGKMRHSGFSQSEISAALLEANRSRCKPPLSEREVHSIAASIAKYESGPSEIEVFTSPQWPERLDSRALHGLAGDVVKTIEPHSEADPAALLVQTLLAFGNVIGNQPRFRVESTQHALNLFAVLVGQTSKARKGTSWNHIERLFGRVDEDWALNRIQSGLASGEGLIWNTRDATGKDDGVKDKRLLDMEQEFASVLQVMARDGNTASAVIRQAWDSGNLRILNKNSPATSTGAHISIMGHITELELKRHLTETERGNGFANRFLWICVTRSKSLPEGSPIADRELNPLVKRLAEAVNFSKRRIELRRDLEAKFLWHEVYDELSEGHTGMFGAVTSRAEAQTMRLASLYALLDLSEEIKRVHLEAGLEVWRYARDSARFIFADSLGDPTADKALQVLRSAYPDGKTVSDLSIAFGRHAKSSDLRRALNTLAACGLARMSVEKTEGRDAHRWFATSRAKSEISAK